MFGAKHAALAICTGLMVVWVEVEDDERVTPSSRSANNFTKTDTVSDVSELRLAKNKDVIVIAQNQLFD